MTSIEKKVKLKECIKRVCDYGECDECCFFDPEDETDGIHFCSIRDLEKRIPYNYGWDMNTAML